VDDEELARQLAERLRSAHARVAALPVTPEQKASITRRLLAITNASKRDLTRASQGLDAFLSELDAEHPGP